MKRYITYLCIALLPAMVHAKSNKCDLKARIARFESNTQNILNRILSELSTNACASIPISNGQDIIDQPGNYCLTEDINGSLSINSSNVALNLNNFNLNGSIVLNGSQITVYNGTIIGNGTTDGIVITGGISDIHLHDLTIENYVNGINAPSANNNIIIENVTSYNTSIGANLISPTNLTIKNSVLRGNTSSGLFISDSTNVFIDNCKFSANFAGLNALGIPSTNMIITNCIATNSDLGFTFQGTEIWLVGCYAFGAGFLGFEIKGGGTTANLIDCIASQSNFAGFSISDPNITFYLENCIASLSINGGFSSVAGVAGTIKGCSAVNNGTCGFNDVTGSVVRYVSNYAADNGSNYCVNGLANVGAPYNAVDATTAGINYWNNVYLP